MNGLHYMIFLGEIVLQTKIALRAFERLNENHNTFDQIEVWGSVQSILVATGNVSKILWPHSKYKQRGETLRKLLNINDENPLSDRKFRNHFEHYDERVETWLENQSSGCYVDLAMNPSLRTFGDPNCHRGYNTFNSTLLFRGELLDMNIVIKALEEIKNKCAHYVHV